MKQTGLWERRREMAAVRVAYDGVADGAQSVLLLEGTAGIGKSTVLHAARRDAVARGWSPLWACGSELEHEVGFWIVRQLFETALERELQAGGELLQGVARHAVSLFGGPRGLAAGEPSGVLNALFALCANWCERRGVLVLLVDDLHLCDPASLRFLDHLIHRGADLPLVLIGAHRPGSEQPPELRQLRSRPQVRTLRLRPLSARAAHELVCSLTGGDVDEAVSSACHRVAGGIPFYIELLVISALEAGAALTEESLTQLQSLPDGVRSAVRRRLAALGDDCARVARAIVLLGDDANNGMVPDASGLTLDRVQVAHDQLTAAGVLVGGRLRFAHPLLHAAVAAGIGDGEAAAAHARIARGLARRSAAAERIALHVQLSDPAADRWAVEQLLAAAGPAYRAGAWEQAEALLQRALLEPPDPDDLGRVLFELGRVESEREASMPAAIEHLGLAVRRLTDEPARSQAACELAIVLLMRGELAAAASSLRSVASELTEFDARARTCALGIAIDGLANVTRREYPVATGLLEQASAGSASHRLLSGALTRQALLSGRPAAEVRSLAEAGLVPLCDRMASEETVVRLSALFGAIFADGFVLATAAVEHELEAATDHGSTLGYGHALAYRAVLAARLGRWTDARADSERALELVGASPAARLAAVYAQLSGLLAAGCLHESEQLLSTTRATGELPDLLVSLLVLDLRARLRLLAGAPERAAADVRQLERQVQGAGLEGCAALPWRIAAARIERSQRRHARADELLAEQLTLAERFGAPTVLCEALIESSEHADHDARLEPLARAVRIAGNAGLTHHHVEALMAHGAALRRAGARRQAREQLKEALMIAERLREPHLCERALGELRVAGAKLRRDRLSGADSLTAGERRVAELAVLGLSNREIASRLFVSVKTVETHLSHVYGKLDIVSRAELAARLPRAGDQLSDASLART